MFLVWWIIRKDSFITHRAFCDALAQESTRSPTLEVQVVNGGSSSPTPPPLTPSSTGVLSPVLSIQSSGSLKNGILTLFSPLFTVFGANKFWLPNTTLLF